MSLSVLARFFSILRAAVVLAALAGVYALYSEFEAIAAEEDYALTIAARAAALAACPPARGDLAAKKSLDLGAAIASRDSSSKANKAAFDGIRMQYYVSLRQAEDGAPDAAHDAPATAQTPRQHAAGISALALGAANQSLQRRNLLLAHTAIAYSAFFLLLLAANLAEHFLLNSRLIRGFVALKGKLLKSAAPFYPHGEKHDEVEEMKLAAEALDITLENSMLARIRLANETRLRLLRMKAQTRALELTRRKVVTLVEDLEETKEELQRDKKDLKLTGEKLARSNKELEQFAYVASHDLKEPLRIVSSFSGLLSKRYAQALDKDAREFIGYIDQGARRATELVNALFNYSKVTYTAKDFTLVDCGTVMLKAMFNLKIAIEERKAEVTYAPLPSVQGDEFQLIQLFQNLLANALKFNTSAAPRIRVAAEQAGGEWVLTFADNGIGVAPEHFERIFLIFQRLHTPDKYPGAGIGLALCKKIAENHGGRMWLKSKSGEGSVFYVALPAEVPQGPMQAGPGDTREKAAA
ncbi:MAG: ATP-binding protein [Elusimicrobiales bacterium]|nr:ATP-binding protein [Elusimicrobiales bacterium]